MATSNSAASALTQLMQGNSAGELIPELMRQAFQDLIDLDIPAALGAERQEHSDSGSNTTTATAPVFSEDVRVQLSVLEN